MAGVGIGSNEMNIMAECVRASEETGCGGSRNEVRGLRAELTVCGRLFWGWNVRLLFGCKS